MFRFPFIKTLVFVALTGFFFTSCNENSPLIPSSNPGEAIKTRSIVPDSVYQSHNDFIMWVFENYYDSLVYYAPDPVDFIEFSERMRNLYSGNAENISSEIIENDTLIISSPYYVEGVGFTNNFGIYSATWHYNLKLVLDSVIVAVDEEESESEVLQIITRGKDRVNGISGLTKKDDLINLLIQTYYSVSLMYDIDEEIGTGNGEYVNICAIIGVMADVSMLNYFGALGDTNPDSPMYGFAMQSVANVSMFSFAQCHCSNC